MCVKLLVFVKLHVNFLQKDSDIVLVLGILLQLFHGRELRQFCYLFLWSNMQCWFGNYVSFNYRNFMVGKRLVIRFLLLPIQKKRKKKKVVLLEKIRICFFIAKHMHLVGLEHMISSFTLLLERGGCSISVEPNICWTYQSNELICSCHCVILGLYKR